MSGSLVLISSSEVSSGVSYVDLTGMSDTYSNYIVQAVGVEIDTDIQQVLARFIDSSTGAPLSSSYYDLVQVRFRSENTIQTTNGQNLDKFGQYDSTGTGAGEGLSRTLFIYNARQAQHTMCNYQEVMYDFQPYAKGTRGGVIFRQTTIVSGIRFYASSGNIDKGSFRLYGLKDN
jgi:hypothetical protein